jgi:hypothetical protein
MRFRATRALFALLAASLALVSFSGSAAASDDRMPASGGLHDDPTTFQVTAQYTNDGNTIQIAQVNGRIDGTFSGPYVERARSVTYPSGEAIINGTATCECEVGGHSGTVVFGFKADAEPDGSLTGRFWILSAGGSLRGLKTRANFQSSDGITGTYSGWFSLDD